MANLAGVEVKGGLSRVGMMFIIYVLVLAVVTPTFNGIAHSQSVKIITGSVGNSVSYSGLGPANTDLIIKLTTSVSITPSGNQFSKWFYSIRVTSSSDSFVVMAQNMKTMTVTGYFAGIDFIGKSYDAGGDINGNGGLSTSGIPPGSYDISVTGEPLNAASDVILSVTATSTVHTGADGSFTATVDTTGLPQGIYSVKQNDVEVARAYLSVAAPYSTTLNLKAGWNLISLPITPENGAIDYIFSADQQKNIDVIWDYNCGNWQYWTTEAPWNQNNPLKSLDPRTGYWIYCYSPMSVTVYGTPPPAVKSWDELASGWNCVGYPGTSSSSVSSLWGPADVVWKYDAGQWTYYTTEPDYANSSSLSNLDPGYGYWVYKL